MYTLDVMPDIQHRLRTHDLGFLKIVADLWGIDLNAPDARAALPILTRKLIEPGLVLEMADALPEDARQALDTLISHDGWMNWGRFTRAFGKLREVGPGKRDREKPYLDPISPAEILWYRGLIGRDFLRQEGELQECAYIPNDLLHLLPPVASKKPPLPGRPASPGEILQIMPASDRILDHCCTMLAALRLEEPMRSPASAAWQPSVNVLHALLAAMKLITSSEQPVPEDARPFLEMPRGEALTWLVLGWKVSNQFNELRLLPEVICEGSWQNNPASTRDRIFALLSELPEDKWWSLQSFIKAIREREPNFQRPAGDFDTWLLRSTSSGESLKGLSHWDNVDGALIRYMLTGPMHWLGLMDLASAVEGGAITAFRFSNWAPYLLLGKTAEGLLVEDQPVEVHSDGTLIAGTHTPRLVRYQVSRFCAWQDETTHKYTYQLTPKSLEKAAEQGLKITHLETLLTKYGSAVPPSLIKALKQWEQKGGQAYIQPAFILQVDTPKILQALRNSPAGRFIGETLGPTSAIIKPGSIKNITATLARLGYLSDTKDLDNQM